MHDEDDELRQVTGVTKARHETPTLEYKAGRAIEKAFRELIQNKYLYQNQTVDLEPMLEPLKKAIHQAMRSYCTPNIGGGGPTGPTPIDITEPRFAELCREVATRPWHLCTRHIGDSNYEGRVTRVARGGIFEVVTSAIEDMFIAFLLPSVQLDCQGVCKCEKTFSAHVTSCGSPYSQPWGHVKGPHTEQLFFPIYRCEGCSKFVYTMLVKRKGLKLQLCGITPRRKVLITQKLPEEVRAILGDAEQAVAEGDVFAAIYHLRTVVEHYVKGRLGLPPKAKSNGDDLITQYNATIKDGLKSTLPSLLTSWQFLSEALHAREGTAEDYNRHRDQVCRHIEIIVMMSSDALA